ncbi:hypothetical protein [Paenibacillus gallinarum]|uniref:Flagellar hook-length control protein-like C-terminal domain-containing protein n=1 Tax=Paenibacillus gallinarum TaxID=2762232 RepID=A0ABR8SUK7_9BACL|nr:hypothetical protein [Paenibacillus gallinarum]MBD7967192.1 hypothetical protein [Paenibacillus gallinarum]
MNIGQTLRGLLGDSKTAGGTKSLELKEGQVVRANVVQVSADQKEAVLQIKGVQVRAALDTQLKVGDTALLQVGTPNKDGMIVMKPYEGTLASASPGTMADLLNSLKLTDTKENRQLLIAIQQSGIQLTKENVTNVQNTMTAKPDNIKLGEWVNSVSLAMQRGLPVTGTSVQSLHMALYGPSLDQLMGELDGMLQKVITADSTWKGSSAKTAGILDGNRTPFLGSEMPFRSESKAENVSGNVSMTEGKRGMVPSAEFSVTGLRTESAVGSAATPLTNGDLGSKVAGMGAKNTSDLSSVTTGEQAASESEGMTSSKVNTQDSGLKGNGNIQSMGIKTEGSKEQHQAPNNAAVSEGNDQAHGGENASKKNLGGDSMVKDTKFVSLSVSASSEKEQFVKSSANAGTADQGEVELIPARLAAVPPGPELARRVANLLQELQAAPQIQLAGENSASKAAAVPGTPQQGQGADAQPAPGHTPAATSDDSWVGRVLKLLGAEHEQQIVRGTLPSPAQSGVAAAEQADTLKGLLLQAEASAELPPAVKETAGQLVHLLTGHQLLMNTDRTTPFAQMNWFIPLNGADGQVTANVQIESRRGPRGELDASHCRIWFDLNMKQLGPTLIDMQVVGKVISLHIRTDNELSALIFEEGRNQIGSLLENTGYQLSVFRSEVVTRESFSSIPESGLQSKQLLDTYVPDSYKGVDMRV